MTSGSTTVIETFLRGLCREGCPEIVLMSQAGASEGVRGLLRSRWCTEYRVSFFVGSPLSVADLERVRAAEASMCFVIADFQTENTAAEDQRNIMVAGNLGAVPRMRYHACC